MNHSKIRCSSGLDVLVDTADVQVVLAGLKVSASTAPGAYAKTAVMVGGKWKSVLLHRLILDAQPGQIVDHINGNRLDNRRQNLRFVSFEQNSRNASAKRNSGFKGVKASGSSGKFIAMVSPSEIEIYLGVYDTPQAAAAVYNAAASRVFGRFARLNQVTTNHSGLQLVVEAKRRQIERLQLEIDLLSGESRDE